MIIILEGPDCAGKSSLAQHICEKFKFESFKETLSYADRLKPEYNGYNHYLQLSEYIVGSGKNYVVDRFHIGEVVNPIVRKDGRKPLTVTEIINIENALTKKTLIINCAPSEEFIKKAFRERGEEVAKEEDIKYLLYLYQLFFYISNLPTKYEFNLEKDSDYKIIDAFLASMIAVLKAGK